MAKYVKLSKQQKDEIRRLTQLANRRIANAFKVYEREGKSIAPSEVTGGIQTREQWHSEKYALSRSVKFTSMQEYRKQLHYLRQFEVMRPGIKEYTEIQREKTLQAIESSLGQIPTGTTKQINKMTAPQLTEFWKLFSDKARKKGMKYASGEVMEDTMREFFPEDIKTVVPKKVG